MSRFTGPRVKVMRALGVELPGLSAKKTERRPYPPGQHGQARRKLSEYGLRLREKQKVRANYGVGERQLRRVMTEARASSGVTGAKLIELLERRLDNVVHRLGFAASRAEARQLVSHRGIKVNEQIVNIPSYQLKAGDKIAVRDRAKEQLRIKSALSIAGQVGFPEWVEVDDKNMQGTLKNLPERDEILPDINENLVVELYSK